MVLILRITANTGGAPAFAYVYSNSMEPQIGTHDAFLIRPANIYEVGDIVTFQPRRSEATYMTHRVIKVVANRYVTKGDNAPYTDQDNGEPLVTNEQILGKVITYHGSPVLFPRVGEWFASIQALVGDRANRVSMICLGLAGLFVWLGLRKSTHRRKSKIRLRFGTLYGIVAGVGGMIILLSFFMGAKQSTVSVLVSERPSGIGNQVALHQQGFVEQRIQNRGIIPVWNVVEGASPIRVSGEPVWIWPGKDRKVTIRVAPQSQVGVLHLRLHSYNYPALLPKTWLALLHQTHPWVARLLILVLIAIGLGTLPRYPAQLPLKAVMKRRHV